MGWDINQDRPVYLQLVEIIQLRVITGIYPSGGKFPSVRDLAAEASVNPNTMQKALQELERQGLLYTQRTSGRFITDDYGLIAKTKDNFAKNRIMDFLESMEKLGFSKQDAIAKINALEEG